MVGSPSSQVIRLRIGVSGAKATANDQAAPMDDAAIDAKGVRSVQVALDAAGAAAAADARANAAKLVVRRSQAERNAAFCEEVVAIGIAEAARQFLYLKSGNTLETHESGTAYVTYVNGKLTGEKKLAYSSYRRKSLDFWALAHAYGETTRGGVTIERVALDSLTWTAIGNSKSKYAELSTLEFVLADGFAKELLAKIQPGGKSVTALLEEAANKPKAATRRPKKAPAEPTETTEAAETTPPKAKAPARRARRRGRRREDDDDDDFAPPPKAKAEDDDEIDTVVGEVAPTRLNLMVANEVLRRDLAARDEEIAAARAEIAAYKEQIEEKEAESRTYVNIARDAKKELDAVKAELAREKDKNKAVSPLCDSTNIRLTSSAA